MGEIVVQSADDGVRRGFRSLSLFRLAATVIVEPVQLKWVLLEHFSLLRLCRVDPCAQRLRGVKKRDRQISSLRKAARRLAPSERWQEILTQAQVSPRD